MPSPEEHEYAALLIGKARGDLHAAAALAPSGGHEEAVGFHAQQAVEKATKAVLVLAGVEIPYTHDLDRISRLAKEAGHEPPPAVVMAGWLTEWAVDVRYDESTEPLDTEGALSAAEAAVAWAEELLAER